MDEITATQDTGVESQEVTISSNDASLLSAFLAQEYTSHDGIDAASTDSEPVDNEPVETPTEADVFTVKINGVEKQVTRDELIAHYQKGEASGQKFEEAANLRREVEQQKAQALQERQHLQNALNHFNQQAQRWAQENQPNWQYLLDNNPHEYLRQREIHAARQQEFQKAQAAQAYLNQQQTAEQQQFVQQRLQQEGEKLLEVIPEWKDTEKRSSEAKELISYLKGKGFDDQRIEGLNQSDANTVRIAINAMRYEKLLEQSKTATKQVKNLPPRVERPGVSGNTDRSGLSEAKQRLARSGSMADATDAFAAMFG